ncbi:hypothetical protein J3E68DRAFT_390724 [Trichoderma sp. SZMC 28012]
MRYLLVLSLLAFFLHSTYAKQFNQWYPFYRKSLTIMENTPECYDNYARDIQDGGASDPDVCKTMVNCLMTNNGDINKSDWASAVVLLGLTPTILGQLGSALKEKAQLSFQSPLLGLLCILGGPSIPFERPWVKENSPDEKKLSHFAWKERKIKLIMVPKYLLAVGAAANVLHNMITLGQQTIISWKCTWSHLELVWVFTAFVPVLFAVGAIFFKKRARCLNSVSNIMCAVHVVFGTLMLSSVLFIGTIDALVVVVRLTASTLVCQFITVLELEDKGDEIL